MKTAESAFTEALSELEVVAKASKSKLHPRIVELCGLVETFMRENNELKLAMLKDVENDIASKETNSPSQWEINPFVYYLKA
jgi:hypothetical protein